MKALKATKKTQGWRKNDFSHTTEGELVGYAGFECDGEQVDGRCGCRRSLTGFETGRATTTFVVETVDMTEDGLKAVIRRHLTESGWISDDRDPKSNESLVLASYEDTITLWNALAKCPDGTVLERRGDRFNSRQQSIGTQPIN